MASLSATERRRRFEYGEVGSGPITRHSIPQSDEVIVPRGTVVDSCGIVVRTTRGQPVPVSVAFRGMAYLRKLAGHRRRLRSEVRRMAAETDRAVQSVGESDRRTPRNGEGFLRNENVRLWVADVKVVNCAGCERLLLGEGSEGLRGADGRSFPRLPPPVGGRVDDRPYCRRCLRLGGVG